MVSRVARAFEGGGARGVTAPVYTMDFLCKATVDGPCLPHVYYTNMLYVHVFWIWGFEEDVANLRRTGTEFLIATRMGVSKTAPLSVVVLPKIARFRYLGPFLSESFFSRFSRFVNFVSRYGGVLSQFVNFNGPGKIANCVSIRVRTKFVRVVHTYVLKHI